MSQASDERDAALAKVAKRLRGHASRKTGEDAEAIVGSRLRALGLLMVQRIEVGWKVHRNPLTRRIIGARPMAPVLGDFHAVVPGGRSALIEVKRRLERLTFSDLDAHQVRALDEHHRAGGLSLLAWLHTSVSILAWPVPAFIPGRSLSPETAAQLNLTEIR